MNFKKKAIIGIAAGLFAVATVFNMGMLDEKSDGDISLNTATLIAEAQQSEGAGGSPIPESLGFKSSLYSTKMQREIEMSNNPWAKYSANYHVATCLYKVCDEWDLTGDPEYEDHQYPDGSWGRKLIDDCDGSPNRC